MINEEKLLFPTTLEQRSYLPYYMQLMHRKCPSPHNCFDRIDYQTILDIWKVANECQGMFDLVQMWVEHENEPDEQWADFSAMLSVLKDHGL